MSSLYDPGYLEVICGPMKSGKTGRLISELTRLNYSNLKYMLFKPDIDDRFSKEKVVSRDGGALQGIVIPTSSPEDILNKYLNTGFDIAAIDEANFFNDKLVEVVQSLLIHKKRILISGLDLDFRGEPFGPMPGLLAMADRIVKLYAACDYPNCGKPANRTQRLVEGRPAYYEDPLILVGDEEYQARCLEHHYVPKKKDL